MRRIEPPPPPPIDPPKSKLSRKEYTALGLVIGGVTGALIALIVLLLLNRPAQVPNTPIVSTDTGNDTQVVTSDEEAAISGAICEAADGVTPVTGAIVNIYKGEQLVASQSSAADGKFEFQLDPDTYTMEISAANHVDFTSAVTVRPDAWWRCPPCFSGCCRCLACSPSPWPRMCPSIAWCWCSSPWSSTAAVGLMAKGAGDIGLPSPW